MPLNRHLDPISARVIQVALDIGLFDALHKSPRSLEELCGQCDCAPRGLRPVLYVLASVSLIRLVGERFALARGAKRYLAGKYPADREALPSVEEYEKLETAVRTGRPVRLPVESAADEGDFFSGIAPALFDLHCPAATYLAERIPTGVTRVLDLGAGSAVWSLALAKQRPDVRVVAVDRERVLSSVTVTFLMQHGVMEQYELAPGDYHRAILQERGFELVYLGHLLHADGWTQSRQLLRRVHAALQPGGIVAVAEILGAEPRSGDYAANVFDLNMLMLTEEGVVFTRSELAGLLIEAEFVDTRWVVDGPGDYPVLLATKDG